MSVTAAPPSPTQPPTNDTTIGRLIGAFITPKKTFTSIAARPTWFLPLIVLAVFATGVMAYFTSHVGWHYQVQRNIEQNQRLQKVLENMSPEEREQNIAAQEKSSRIGGYFFTSVGVFIFAAIDAGVLILAFMIAAGVKPSFKQSLGIISHAWLPGIISGLLGIVVIFLKDPATVDINNLVATSVSAYMPEGTSIALKFFLSTFDLFTFWKIALMALGFTAVDPKKLSFGKSYAIIFAIYFLVMAGFAGVLAALT
jgi:Yip1 domain